MEGDSGFPQRFALHGLTLEVYNRDDAAGRDLSIAGVVEASEQELELIDRVLDDDSSNADECKLANALVQRYFHAAMLAAATQEEAGAVTESMVMTNLALARAAARGGPVGEHITTGADVTKEPVLLFVVRNDALM